MDTKYYLHRISHEGNVSYGLLSQGFLTLGWSQFVDSGILEEARVDGYPKFNTIAEKYGQGKNRSRWCMWYFARMEIGDRVVVPLYDGKFSVYEVTERARYISDLESVNTEIKGAWEEHKFTWKDHRIYDETDNRMIDLGFFIKVKVVIENAERKYATGVFVSRMKIRTTNADISGIKDEVEKSINACKENRPVSLYEEVIDELARNLNEKISNVLDPDRFEGLIKWYIEKIGAEYAKIPAKNEPGKENGADADIVAEFRNLKHTVYIQAKHHKNETGSWAVHQIKEYYSQKADGDSDCSYAIWVISTCDKFSEEAVKAAKEYHVRLINGLEFARMLLDAGLLKVDEAFMR